MHSIYIFIFYMFSSLRYLLSCVNSSGSFLYMSTCQTWSVVTCDPGITATEKKEKNLNVINISNITYKTLKQAAGRGTPKHSRGMESSRFSRDTGDERQTEKLNLNSKRGTSASKIIRFFFFGNDFCQGGRASQTLSPSQHR